MNLGCGNVSNWSQWFRILYSQLTSKRTLSSYGCWSKTVRGKRPNFSEELNILLTEAQVVNWKCELNCPPWMPFLQWQDNVVKTGRKFRLFWTNDRGNNLKYTNVHVTKSSKSWSIPFHHLIIIEELELQNWFIYFFTSSNIFNISFPFFLCQYAVGIKCYSAQKMSKLHN